VAEIEIPYRPRRWQAEVFEQLQRFNVLVVHRRSGKTVLSINWLLREAVRCPPELAKTAVCAVVCPQFSQAKRIAWPYLLQFAGVIPGVVFNTSELCCTLPTGMRIYLLGAENPAPIRGLSCWAVVSDECAQQPRSAWTQVLRPALADMAPHGGGRALFIGTPLGRANLFAELAHPREPMPDWFTTTLTWKDTGVIDADEINALRREMPTEDFNQEMECSFDSAIRGAYFGKQLAEAEQSERITRVLHEPHLPVIASFDLGIADTFVIWYAQQVGNEIRLIDHDEFTSTGLPEIVKHMQAKPYNYGQYLFPHDIKVRELGTGKARIETLRELGVIATVVPNIPLMDGINAARNLIPRCYFDREACFNGIEALKLYRSEYNETKQVLSNQPLRDWTTHHADSFRMLAVGLHTRLGKGGKLDYSRIDRRATVSHARI
jgi:hypothetical protein